MLKSYIGFVILFLAVLTAAGQVMGPRIRFDTTTIDNGELEQGSDVRFYFWYTNVGDQPLRLHVVKSSCGCLAAKWPQEPLLPGERAVIEAHYNGERVGPYHKQLVVLSNDSITGEIHLYVSGNMIQRPEKPSIPVSEVVMGPRIRFDTTTIDLGEREQGSKVEYDFWFTNVGDEPLQIERVISSDPISHQWPQSIAPGERGVIRSSYDSQKLGPIRKRIFVITNDLVAGNSYLQALGFIYPKSSEEPHFQLEPHPFPRFEVIGLQPDEGIHRADEMEYFIGCFYWPMAGQLPVEIQFTNNGHQSLILQNVTGDSATRVIYWTGGPLKLREKGTIGVTVNLRMGPLPHTIVIHTNHPTRPITKVTIFGCLLPRE